MTTAIAVALYNGQRFLIEQLDSLRCQTCPADQVVLCDDGSKDNTVQLVEEYIRDHGLSDRWTLHRNPENLGYIRNFYKAISLCDAELVYLCDQDDIWELDKLCRMNQVMSQRGDIALLASKYGIIDGEGNSRESIIEPTAKQTGSLVRVSVEQIMYAYRWPGMIMCVRKDFFNEVYDAICNQPVAHDLALAVLAADRNGFFDYDYVGAHHRRHGNNIAREEDRIFKLLSLERKLADIAVTKKLWQSLIDAQFPLCDENRKLIILRKELLDRREEALQRKSLSKLLALYKDDGGRLLRKFSLICDIWLVFFGKTNGKYT